MQVGGFLLTFGIFALVGFLIYITIRCKIGNDVLRRRFKRCNVIVFGKKGSGKDLLFNKVINLRKEPCYTNIPYSRAYCLDARIQDFAVAPNTYRSFLDDNIQVIDKVLAERMDFYISDGGIALPSQYHGELDKKYPSLPIFYALSRHLTNSNIHINTQNLNRIWDKLREQADTYIRVERTINIFGFLFTTFTVYDYYESAKKCLQPYPHSIFSSSYNTAQRNEYYAVNGRIDRHLICQHKSTVMYDTRYFHKVVYGRQAPGRSIKVSNAGRAKRQ